MLDILLFSATVSLLGSGTSRMLLSYHSACKNCYFMASVALEEKSKKRNPGILRKGRFNRREWLDERFGLHDGICRYQHFKARDNKSGCHVACETLNAGCAL